MLLSGDQLPLLLFLGISKPRQRIIDLYLQNGVRVGGLVAISSLPSNMYTASHTNHASRHQTHFHPQG
jgi:hypothetical protein